MGLFFDGVLCLTRGGCPDTHGNMPRAMRGEYPGAIYHVLDRAGLREDIFINDVDRQDFLKTLAEACQKTAWQAHAH